MMQGAFDFNPLDVLAAAAALQSANENVPPRELVYENDESQDEPEDDSGSTSNVKKVCEDFQDSESGVGIAGSSRNKGQGQKDDVKKREGKKLLYSNIYQWNNMHGKDVLRILKEKNHLANISHYLDHSYASFTPHHELLAKINDLTKSDERGSDSEDNDRNDESPAQFPDEIPADHCLRLLLSSEQPSDLVQGVGADATMEQIADTDAEPLDTNCPTTISSEADLLSPAVESECNTQENNDMDCTDNGTSPEVSDAPEAGTPCPNDTKQTTVNNSGAVSSDQALSVVEDTQDHKGDGAAFSECPEAGSGGSENVKKSVENVGESFETPLDHPGPDAEPTVDSALENSYIHMIEPGTVLQSSQNVPQTLLLVGPDGICNRVLIENSSDASSVNNTSKETSRNSDSVGNKPCSFPSLESATRLLFAAHPSSGAGDASQQNTSSFKSVCDKNTWSKSEVSQGDRVYHSPKAQDKLGCVTRIVNGRVTGSESDNEGVILQISEPITPQKQPSIETLLQRGPSRTVSINPQTGRQYNILPMCSSLVPSPPKDKLTLPSDSNMKHLRISGGVVVPRESTFWDNSSDMDSSLDTTNTDSASNQGTTQTPPMSGIIPTFVPLTSLSQSSPLSSLTIGFPRQNIDIGQVSPIGSDKSRSNLSSPSIASPLTSPRDPSLGSKRNAFMTNKDICIGLNCSSPSESCLLHRGLCIDRPSSVSSQDNSVDGFTDCGSPAPIGTIGYKIQHSIAQRRNKNQLLDSESNSECDCPSGQSSRNQSPDSKKGRGVHRERISAEHDYLSVFGKPRPPTASPKALSPALERKHCQPQSLPLNSELANQLLKLKPSKATGGKPVARQKSPRPRTPKFGMLMKRGLYIPTGPLVSDADKRGEHPLKDHDYCLHAFYQAMTFNTVDEGPRRPGPVPKVKVKKEKKKQKVEVSVSDSNDTESPEKHKSKKKYKKLKTEVKKKKKKFLIDSPASAETSDADEVVSELAKNLKKIKKEPIDFSDEGEKEPILEKDDPSYAPPVGKLPEKLLRAKEKKATSIPFTGRRRDEDRVKIPGTSRFQDQFIYFATKKPRRRARPVIGDMSKFPTKMFTSQSEFLPGLDSSYIEARSKYLVKLDKPVTVSEPETLRSDPFQNMDIHNDHLELPADFMDEIPHGKLAVGISEEESQFIQSLYSDDQEQPVTEEYPQEMDSMSFDLTNEQVREFLNTVGVEKMKILVGESMVEETVETASPVPPGGDDAYEHMISDKDPHMLPTVTAESTDLNGDEVVASLSSVTTAADMALNTSKDTIASIRESLEMETESIKSGTSENHMLSVGTPQDSQTETSASVSQETVPSTDSGLQVINNESQENAKPDQKDSLSTSDLGFTNIATDSTPHDLFDLDDDDLLNANLNFVNMNMILNFQSPEKASMNHRANENNRNLTKMRKIDFDNNSNVPSSCLLPPPSSPLVPKPIDTASIDSDISIDSTTHSSHTIESTRPGPNNPFSIGKPDMFKSGMLNRLHNIPDPTDSGVPELIFVNMFWNDLPGLLINEKEYVRLVDIHKQVLPAKPTGLLKNRCRALKLDFSNCSELQRDFLIRYAHAAASRSTLIVTKAVAETLIGYYVNPPPRSSRVDVHDDNEADVDVERPKSTGGKGKGKGKRSRLNGDKAAIRRPGSSVDRDKGNSSKKVTLRLKDCANYSRLLMLKERLVSYSTSDDSSSSSDDESSESESEEIRQKRIRKIISLRRKARSLRNNILLLTGQKIDDEVFPAHKRIGLYKKRLPVKLVNRSERSSSGIRSGHSSASSSRRSSIDYSRRKILSGKLSKLSLLNPVEAEKRTERAIFDIDATIDEVLGNVRRQCEAEERRGKNVRNTNRARLLKQRSLPSLYQRLLARDRPGSPNGSEKCSAASADVFPMLSKLSAQSDGGVTSSDKDTSVPEKPSVTHDGDAPVVASDKVTVLSVDDLGPSSKSETMRGVETCKSETCSEETLVSDTESTTAAVEIAPVIEQNTSESEIKTEPHQCSEANSGTDQEEKHVVTIENFSPTTGRSKFIQPITVQISESDDGVVSITSNMHVTPVPKLVSLNELENSVKSDNVTGLVNGGVGKGDNCANVSQSGITNHGTTLINMTNGRDLIEETRPKTPSNSADMAGPLRVLHKDTMNSNGKHLSQSGGLYLGMFNDKSSKCIMCTNCSEFFTTDTFLCHHHGVNAGTLDVKSKHTLHIQNTEPSEWEKRQWWEFKTKCHRLAAETPQDGDKSGKNGNKIVKALQFEIMKQTDSLIVDQNVRHSKRVRKQKQLYPIEKYMFSSLQAESGGKEEQEIHKSNTSETNDVESDTNKNNQLNRNVKKVAIDNNKNQVHDIRDIATDRNKNEVVENGKNTDSSNQNNHKKQVNKTPVLCKNENNRNSIKRLTRSPITVTPGQRISSRESTSRFKRRPVSLSPPAAKRQRVALDTRNRSRPRLSTSPARSTRSHSGEKP